MQPEPDKQKNYWKNDSEPEEIPEMYAPDSVDGDSIDSEEPEASNEDTKKPTDDEPVHWVASEYIHEDKNSLWYVIFAIVVLAFIAVDLLFIKSYTFSILVIVMAVAVIIYSRRPARTVDYTLSGDQGLYIGERLYHFSEFKAFGLIRDHDQHSIMLIPTKRFSAGVSVYFPDEVGEKIVDILGARLPMKTLKLDAIDIIVRKLRL